MRALLAVALLASIGGAARADEEVKRLAGEHFDLGTKAYLAGGEAEALGNRESAVEQYQIAVEQYKQSYKLAPVPSTLYWLAQAHRALGELELALASYRQYLYQAPPSGKFRADATAQVHRLEEAIEQRRAAQHAPPLGVPSRTEERAPEKPVTTTPITAVTAPPPVSPQGPALYAPIEARVPWYKSPAGWALTGGGVAMMTVGGALFAPAASADDDARRALTVQARLDGEHAASTYRTASYVLLSIGGAALVAGVVVFAVAGRSRSVNRVTLRSPGGMLTFGGRL